MKINFSFSANSFVDVDLETKDAERVNKGDLNNLSDEAYEKILNAFNFFDIDGVELTSIWKQK